METAPEGGPEIVVEPPAEDEDKQEEDEEEPTKRERRPSMFEPKAYAKLPGDDMGTFQYFVMPPSGSEEEVVIRKKPELDNTFLLEPTVPVRRDKIVAIIKAVLDVHLAPATYEPQFMKHMAKELASHIRKDVKSLKYHRFKFICLVTIGEMKDQDIEICSRSQWSSAFDHCADYTFKNFSLFAIGTVYALYKF